MNGTIFDTATNVPIDVTVKTRRNQAAINNRIADPQVQLARRRRTRQFESAPCELLVDHDRPGAVRRQRLHGVPALAHEHERAINDGPG